MHSKPVCPLSDVTENRELEANAINAMWHHDWKIRQKAIFKANTLKTVWITMCVLKEKCKTTCREPDFSINNC